MLLELNELELLCVELLLLEEVLCVLEVLGVERLLDSLELKVLVELALLDVDCVDADCVDDEDGELRLDGLEEENVLDVLVVLCVLVEDELAVLALRLALDTLLMLVDSTSTHSFTGTLLSSAHATP